MRTRKFRLARTALMVWVIVPAMLVGVGNRNDVVQAQRLEPVFVSITIDGGERQQRTAQTTVGAALHDAGIAVGPKDVVTPGITERIRDGARITVVRVKEAIESEKLPVAYGLLRTFTKSLPPGIVRQTRAGVRGEKTVHYRVRYEDGVCVSRKPVASIMTKRPVSRMVAIGSRGHYTSRGEFTIRRTLRMIASAYDPGPRSCGRYATGRTACGLRAGYGVVAVDPRVIRLGSKLYIEGYGYAVAGDRGRAIKGPRIDLGYNTYREAMRFGRRVVTVHVLEE